MRYVLDSNMAIAAMNGVATVRDRLAHVTPADIGIPLVAIAELVYGAHRSRRRQENLARVEALRRAVSTLPLTDDVVDRYGATRADLESRGVVKSDFWGRSRFRTTVSRRASFMGLLGRTLTSLLKPVLCLQPGNGTVEQCTVARDQDLLIACTALAEGASLRPGDLGAVVELYENDGVEVEFVRPSGETKALVTLKTADLRYVSDGDILAVRQA